MITTYCFKKGQYDPQSFSYVYSPICKEFATFRQEEACIVNAEGKSTFGYEYISILEKEARKGKVSVETECAFEKFGAPIIVFTDDLQADENGHYVYGKHFEVVAYEEGINIWHIVPCPEKVEYPVDPTLLATKKFAIDANSLIQMKVIIEGDCIKAWVNGEYLEAVVDDLPKDAFRVGITACEGINRFYSLTVEND